MRRSISDTLLSWKNRPGKRPLVLCGARQVGKTYVLKEFGAANYEQVAYVDLMSDEAKRVFEGGYDAARTLENIGVFCGVHVEEGSTLVIIDEIQEVPEALSLMKAFAEQAPGQDIVAAGSYLGVSLHAGKSFPVGKVELVDMYPMTFREFLWAMGEMQLADLVDSCDLERCSLFAGRLERLLRQYYFVGGMPDAVASFVGGDSDYAAARRVQDGLLSAYDHDFSKHITDERELERTRLAYASIPAHLGRENHKFVFGRIAKGARARDYETAIQWIVDSGLAQRVYRADKPVEPLKFYRDLSAFKLYLHDVGLLGAAMEVGVRDVLLSNKALEEYKGALTEQYVCQQLVAEGISPYYWTASSGGTSELDFLFSAHGAVIPLEVKAEENLQAKSLRVFCSSYGLYGYRTSMSGWREQDWMTNVPLWAVGSYFARRSWRGGDSESL